MTALARPAEQAAAPPIRHRVATRRVNRPSHSRIAVNSIPYLFHPIFIPSRFQELQRLQRNRPPIGLQRRNTTPPGEADEACHPIPRRIEPALRLIDVWPVA